MKIQKLGALGYVWRVTGSGVSLECLLGSWDDRPNQKVSPNPSSPWLSLFGGEWIFPPWQWQAWGWVAQSTWDGGQKDSRYSLQPLHCRVFRKCKKMDVMEVGSGYDATISRHVSGIPPTTTPWHSTAPGYMPWHTFILWHHIMLWHPIIPCHKILPWSASPSCYVTPQHCSISPSCNAASHHAMPPCYKIPPCCVIPSYHTTTPPHYYHVMPCQHAIT